MIDTGFGFERFEHNAAYNHNIRGFTAFVPDAFGCNPVQMERYYEAVYIFGPNPRFPISLAAIAGAAAYKAVQDTPKVSRMLPNNNAHSYYSQAIANVRANAAREAQLLLQRYPLPGVDPMMVIISAEEGAHRLYEHTMNFD